MVLNDSLPSLGDGPRSFYNASWLRKIVVLAINKRKRPIDNQVIRPTGDAKHEDKLGFSILLRQHLVAKDISSVYDSPIALETVIYD
jgi:hypothetical protein